MGIGGSVDIGPGVFIWDVDGTPVLYDCTLGGINIEHTLTLTPVTCDQGGATPTDYVTGGGATTVTVTGTKVSGEQFAEVFGVTLDGVQSYQYRPDAGTSLATLAKRCTLKPAPNGVPVTSEAEWTIFPRACPPVLELSEIYDTTAQRVMVLKFQALPGTAAGEEGVTFMKGQNVV